MNRVVNRCTPLLDGGVIDLDAPLDQEFFPVTVGKPEAQRPAHRQGDHLRREPEPGEHPRTGWTERDSERLSRTKHGNRCSHRRTQQSPAWQSARPGAHSNPG